MVSRQNLTKTKTMNTITTNTKNQHNCESIETDDSIIFTCNLCPEYRATMNKATGKIKFRSVEGVKHSGFFCGSYRICCEHFK
jgi:hypothetical protein